MEHNEDRQQEPKSGDCLKCIHVGQTLVEVGEELQTLGHAMKALASGWNLWSRARIASYAARLLFMELHK